MCKRCFADNEEAAAGCVRCGLVRGGEVPEPDAGAWRVHAVAASRPAGPEHWLRLWWVPVLAVILAAGWLASARRGGDGTLTSAGTVSVHDLRVGDCFDTGAGGGISDVQARPCNEPHEFEVFHVVTSSAVAFPTEAEMQRILTEDCFAEFQAYVGQTYGASQFHGTQITPTPESWAAGDRVFTCLLHDPSELRLIGSARGSGR